MDAIFGMICHDCKHTFINTDALLSEVDESYAACPNCKSQNIEDTIPCMIEEESDPFLEYVATLPQVNTET